jgi:3-oxoacyl-[acyl-carrier protein] reductase
MSKKLLGKVAIVTGASKGIGAGIASYLATEGASVVVNYSSSKKDADRVVEQIVNCGGNAIAVQGNITKQPHIQNLFSETLKTYGKVDILINNAGVYEFAPIENITIEQFYKMFDLNVLGLFLMSQEAVKYFINGGCIVNVSSVASTSTAPNTSIYSATKAAVDAITKALAKELGPRNIRVNAINPGMVKTEGLQASGLLEGEYRKNTELLTPLGRLGLPKDIAPAVAFLASDDASWITGETLYISGGYR